MIQESRIREGSRARAAGLFPLGRDPSLFLTSCFLRSTPEDYFPGAGLFRVHPDILPEKTTSTHVVPVLSDELGLAGWP